MTKLNEKKDIYENYIINNHKTPKSKVWNQIDKQWPSLNKNVTKTKEVKYVIVSRNVRFQTF